MRRNNSYVMVLTDEVGLLGVESTPLDGAGDGEAGT